MENQILLLLLLQFLCRTCETKLCLPGHRLHTPVEGQDVCLPCQDGVTFISEVKHTHRQCHDCTKVNDPDLEILVSPCNPTRDTTILCRPGYYRYKARNSRETDRCEPCRSCQHPARACEGHHDTVCCLPGSDAVLTSEGRYVCKERPTVCGPGEFFVRARQECLPCPDGTIMRLHNHTYTKCAKCKDLSGDPTTHAVIVRPCSTISPTLFACKSGYFRDPLAASLEVEFTCQPCRRCLRDLVPCDALHDATCGDLELPGPTTVPESLPEAVGAEGRQETFTRNQWSLQNSQSETAENFEGPSTDGHLAVNETELTSSDQALPTKLFIVSLALLSLYLLVLYISTFPREMDFNLKCPSQTTTLVRALKIACTRPRINPLFILSTQVLTTLIVALLFLSNKSYHVRFVTSVFYMVTMATLIIVHATCMVRPCHRSWFPAMKEDAEGKDEDKACNQELKSLQPDRERGDVDVSGTHSMAMRKCVAIMDEEEETKLSEVEQCDDQARFKDELVNNFNVKSKQRLYTNEYTHLPAVVCSTKET
jgi:hypothetical protein